MKVEVVVSRMGPGSGTAGVAHALAGHLAVRGHEVRVWCGLATAIPASVSVAPLRDLPGPRPGWVRVGLDRVAGCDVVRASGGVHRAWLRASSTSVWRTLRSRRPRELLEERRERRSLQQARLVVCNSLRVMGEIQAFHGLSAHRLALVRNGVDLQRFAPDASSRGQLRAAWGARGRVALFCAHGWFRKGWKVAVRGFDRAADPADRLVVMGTDARQRARLRWARTLLGDRLVLARTSDPARILPAVDVLLHPTRYDASANVVLEALACGVPPVTTIRDGAAEIVDDRALVVGDPDDVQGFARAVRYAWQTASPSSRWRAIAAQWPTSRMVDRFETTLKELAHG
ncbi:MAG: glycosyltransferase family 4 protein [Myxococcales bacterium]|nr:glycosyltransferase family 4 protein [Myxococcales bacterium]